MDKSRFIVQRFTAAVNSAVYLTLACAAMVMWLGEIVTVGKYDVVVAYALDSLFFVGAPIAVYIVDATWWRATYGMRLHRLQFVTSSGDRPTRLHVMSRVVMGFLLLPVLPVSWYLLLWGGHGQTLPDYLCRTAVVPANAGTRGFPVVRHGDDRVNAGSEQELN